MLPLNMHGEAVLQGPISSVLCKSHETYGALSEPSSASKLQGSVRGVSSSLGKKQGDVLGAAQCEEEGKRGVRGRRHRTRNTVGNWEGWGCWVSIDLGTY